MHESTKCRHEKEHWNSYACPEPGCDVVSQRKDSIKRHVRLMHGKGSVEDERAEGSGSSRRRCKEPSIELEPFESPLLNVDG